MDHRCVPVGTGEGPAQDHPEPSRNGGAVRDEALGHAPINAAGIYVAERLEQQDELDRVPVTRRTTEEADFKLAPELAFLVGYGIELGEERPHEIRLVMPGSNAARSQQHDDHEPGKCDAPHDSSPSIEAQTNHDRIRP